MPDDITQGTATPDSNPFTGSPANATPAPAAPNHGGAVAPSGDAPPAGVSPARADVPANTVAPSQPAGAPPAEGVTPVVPPAAPSLTPETIKSIVEASVRGAMPQQQSTQQEPPPMTQEEFNRHYGLPTVDATVYEAILGTGPDKPERLAALQGLFQQTSRAAVLMARDLAAAEMSKLRNELSPIFMAHQTQREAAIANEFYTAHPEFKGEEALINEIKDAFIARKTNFASKDEAFKAVATQARQIIARFRGQPGPAQPAGGQTRPNGGSVQPPARAMTPSSQGGRGGTGAATTKSTAQQIFGT